MEALDWVNEGEDDKGEAFKMLSGGCRSVTGPPSSGDGRKITHSFPPRHTAPYKRRIKSATGANKFEE